MTWARAILSSISAIRPSIQPWRSLAAWYSAFSDRSPCDRASEIAAITAGRSIVFKRFSSSSRVW